MDTQGLPDSRDRSLLGILHLAAPLIFTMSAHMLMQFVDALFLSWYSADAIAAVVPAGMAAWLLVSVFHGAASYVSTLVAQYGGAGQSHRTAAVVWQGVYFSLITGSAVAVVALAGRPIFDWAGHPPAVRVLEVQYFQVLCLGASLGIMASALSGFFSGREDTRTVMIVNFVGFAANGILDYLLIFGAFGLPRMGIVGAAIGTVAAQGIVVLLFAVLFLGRTHRATFGTWTHRPFEPGMMKRLVRFGLPRGIGMTVEMTAWTAFLLIVGRLGRTELAATNIAWRINGIAFFPIIGVAQAVGILVGNAQGAGNPRLSARVTWRGLLLSELWMVTASALFVLAPGPLYGLFRGGQGDTAAFAAITETGAHLLKFVALYCLLDAFNIILVTALQSAGDTRFTMVATGVAHATFLALLVVGEQQGFGLNGQWALATAFVMLQGLLWLWRFLAGRWRAIRVVDPDRSPDAGTVNTNRPNLRSEEN